MASSVSRVSRSGRQPPPATCAQHRFTLWLHHQMQPHVSAFSAKKTHSLPHMQWTKGLPSYKTGQIHSNAVLQQLYNIIIFTSAQIIQDDTEADYAMY